MPNRIIMRSFGKYKPTNLVSNEQMVEKMLAAGAKTNSGAPLTADWVANRVLIYNRGYVRDVPEEDPQTHEILPVENISDIAYIAGDQALVKADVSWEEVDLVIVASSSDEYIHPPAACLVINKAGIKTGPIAFDISAACTGAIYAISVARAMMLQNKWRYALVIGADIMHRTLDFSDINSQLWGDGAGAVLLENISTREKRGILCCLGGSEPDKVERAKATGTGTHLDSEGNKEKQNVFLQGSDVQEFVIRTLIEAIPKTAKAAKIKLQDVGLIIGHQANGRAFDRAARVLKVPKENFYINIYNIGNTSTASTLIAACDAEEEGLFHEGCDVIFVAYGGGLTWGSLAHRF